jgi:ADP-ribose pyrophosphatase
LGKRKRPRLFRARRAEAWRFSAFWKIVPCLSLFSHGRVIQNVRTFYSKCAHDLTELCAHFEFVTHAGIPGLRLKESGRADKLSGTKEEAMAERDLKWKVLESRYLSKRPWLTVRKDSVELPNGGRIPDYYVLEYPDWINVIAVTREGLIVLVRQYRHALGRTTFEIPAGVIEKSDASPMAAAKRELLEETGYGGGRWRESMTLSPNSSTCTNLVHSFVAVGVTLKGGQHLDAGECLEPRLMTEARVFGLLKRGEVVQAMMAAPLWKYFYGKKV